jgi:SAM-dependent methyltransferase
MTVDSLGHEIQIEIQKLEADTSLRDEINFVDRAEAMDRIEFHILSRIEPVNTLSDELIGLKRCVQVLSDQLTGINQVIYQRLRAGIASGACRGEMFQRELDRYVGKRHTANHGYDVLDVFLNGLLRLDTIPQETRAREPEMVFYQPTPARVILELTEMTSISPADVFYDLGSGLGQVCILIHLLTGARTRGVEFETAYCDYARQSARQLNLPEIEFINSDARLANYSDGTIFFMYTPFKGAMMESVLQKIEIESLGRSIRVCAYGECVNQVSNQAWLSLVAQRGEHEDALAIFGRKSFEVQP